MAEQPFKIINGERQNISFSASSIEMNDGTTVQTTVDSLVERLDSDGGQGGSGECGVRLADVTGVGYEMATGKVKITWTDPDDVIYQGASLARWAGTLVVRKVDSVPTSLDDGTVVIDSTTKNAYSITSYVDTGLTDGTNYYYRFFPYTDVGTYRAGTSFRAMPNKHQTTMTVPETGEVWGINTTDPVEAITVTTDGDGAIVATSSDTSIGTVSVSENKICVTPVADGTITITVYQLSGVEWSSAGPETISVDVFVLSPVLNDNSPRKIQGAAKRDLASLLWNIGDYFEMTLNGSWACVNSTITLSNYVCRCVLIGINHNAEKEGDHMPHFAMGKNTDGVDIAFHGTDNSMNTTDTTSGGWNSCGMRTTTMKNLYDIIIPEQWRSVIKTCIKYSDNVGNRTDNASYVTATEDKCFLIAEFELFGGRTYANSAEQNYQKQYEYYANGNSRVRYYHDNPTSYFNRALRSSSVSVKDGLWCYWRWNWNSSDWASIYTDVPLFSPCFCIG